MTESTEKLILKPAPGKVTKPRAVGTSGAEVTQFQAEDNKGNTRIFETWSKELVEFIKEQAEKGEPFSADVAYSQKESQGQTYDHWKVTQCYRADGSPVKQRSFGGGKSYGKSPQDIKSIEDQVRAYIIADLWKSDKIDAGTEGLLVNKLKAWLAKLGEPLPAPSAADSYQVARPPAAKPAEKKTTPAPENKGFANAGEFLKACLDILGMNRSNVLEALSISGIGEIKDLNKAYNQLAEMKAKSPF